MALFYILYRLNKLFEIPCRNKFKNKPFCRMRDPDEVPLLALYGFGVFHHIYNRILFNHREHFRLSLAGCTVAFAILCESGHISYCVLFLLCIRCDSLISGIAVRYNSTDNFYSCESETLFRSDLPAVRHVRYLSH